MKFSYLLPLLALVALGSPVQAMNMELSKLVSDDQAVRQTGESAADSSVRDYERRAIVLRMLREGKVVEPIDYENAALIFQHGSTPEEYRLAHALATIAAALEPERRFAKQLKRVSWDRLHLSMGRQQWFGTQSLKDPATGAFAYPPNDPTVTDLQRSMLDQTPLIPAPKSN